MMSTEQLEEALQSFVTEVAPGVSVKIDDKNMFGGTRIRLSTLLMLDRVVLNHVGERDDRKVSDETAAMLVELQAEAKRMLGLHELEIARQEALLRSILEVVASGSHGEIEHTVRTMLAAVEAKRAVAF